MAATRVFLDFSVDGAPLGRVIFELYTVSAPKTAENFRALCTGECGVSSLSQTPLYYKNSIIHRSIRDFMIQGGDFTKRNGNGGESIYGLTFADEDLSRPIDEAGLLCMANRGPNSNGSQFFITLRPCPHLNGKHVVFGRVIRGFDEVVAKIAELPTAAKDRPTVPVVIQNCGELELRKPLAKQPSPGHSRSRSVSASPSEESDDERGRMTKRRKRSPSADSHSRSRSHSPASSDASDKKSHNKLSKRTKHDKDKKEKKEKKSKKRKHHRSASPGENGEGKLPHQETEEEYDARLEREELERIEAARKRELEAVRQRYLEEERRREREGSSEGGVRYKGRGRMKYVDPEMSRRQGY